MIHLRFVTLLLLLSSSSVISQAAPLKRSFVVQLQQDGGSPGRSFSIKPNEPMLGNPSYIAETDGSAGSIFPPDDKPQRFGGFWVKTGFFDLISWQLIDANHFLVAYELVMTNNDFALGIKPYSWIPIEAFFVVGWLLQSYWSTDSPLFSLMGKLEASQDDPYAITTMTLSGNGQEKNQQKNEPTKSSGQQASGKTAQFKGSLTRPENFGSGGGNEGPEQQHTFCLNCYVDSCHGVCKLRPLSDGDGDGDGDGSAKWSLNLVETSTGYTGAVPEQSSPFVTLTRERQRQINLINRRARIRVCSERIFFMKRMKEYLLRLAAVAAEEMAKRGGTE
ncbi:hypothetical protein [Endozoicomonas sp. SESOKO2]|uniref:hypothetical protein n=2 Tax=unclassified Endozoicomonas TaxID=2644528 RepID=UPI0021490ECE|nr:hypothetical protein [Endozoicomonas sp. SESOKO2]